MSLHDWNSMFGTTTPNRQVAGRTVALGMGLAEVSAVVALTFLGFGVISVALAQSLPESSNFGIVVSCDVNCVVAIDDKIVGRVQGGGQISFSIQKGNHKVAAATPKGEYLEQTAEADSPSRSAKFAFNGRTSGSLEANVASLQQQVKEKQNELASIREEALTNERTPQMEAKERSLIVEAVNYYTDRYGKELGMRDSRYSEKAPLDNDVILRGLQNQGNTDTASSAANLGAQIADMVASHRLAVKAQRDALAASAASFRMQYLGSMLENPSRRPEDQRGSSYLVMVWDVTRNKTSGRLLTAPDRIEYSDSSDNIRLSCSDLKKAQGEKHLLLTWTASGPALKQRKNNRTLELKAVQKDERPLLAGDIYLACPQFTQ